LWHSIDIAILFSKSIMKNVFHLICAFLLCLSYGLMAQISSSSWAGSHLSGAWYDPARSGEGIVLEMLPSGRALAVWFTYPAPNGPGQQAWIIGDSGVVDGASIQFDAVYRPQGGVFGDKFDAKNIRLESWGTLRLEADGCNTLRVRYAGSTGFGSGELTYTRLTALDEAQCAPARALTPTGARAYAGLQSKSGAWFVPARSGEGWLIEELPGDRASIYWFTYDQNGDQAFVTGVGQRSGNRVQFNDLYLTRGTRFGNAFDSKKVELISWGNLSFTYDSCNRAQVQYDSKLSGYGQGSYVAERLTVLAGAPCLSSKPIALTRGAWAESTALPAPFSSEHAVTALDGLIYTAGGFGDLRGFKVFNPQTATWSRLPEIPQGRDHLSMFSGEGGVYIAGGAGNYVANESVYRFDLTKRIWAAVPNVQPTFGSHATTLHGRAYVGGSDGSLQILDLRTQRVRRIAPPASSPQRDHSQVVAFMDEIWVIAGRSPETRTVAIFDPTSETWRAGPLLNRARGGFAAAVVDDQLIVTGGEIVNGALRLEASTEVFTAGMDVWQLGPALPIPVHGTAGAGVGGTFYLISGSTLAGSETGANGRVWSWRPLAQ
jgi:N-acetylneuraminic acid mutarotase